MDLCKAIQSESLDVIKALISKKDFTTNSEWLDYAALKSAIKYGRKDVVEILLQKNCRVNKPVESYEDTPLHTAVQLSDPQLVSNLLKNNASVVATDIDNNSPLHIAFLQKQGKITDLMLDSIEKNNKFFNQMNSQGLTHLHIACTRSNGKAIEGFLNDGASAKDAISNDSVLWAGYNAYHFAADFKSLTAVKILLSHNSIEFSFSCSLPNDFGRTPLDLINEHLEDLTIMAGLMNIHKFSFFHMACAGNDENLVKRFLENGADTNIPITRFYKQFGSSLSPLHFAAKSTNSKNVELLLEYGANANYRNEDEMSPMQSVLYNEDSVSNNPIGQMLYNATKNKFNEMPDKNSLSFMHIACSRNDLIAVKQFLDNGEDVDSKVTYERQELYHYTPLHFATKYGNLEIVKYLVQCDANINSGENCVDGTPLHLACKMGRLDIIDFLLENGADVKAIRPYYKNTALHLLVEYSLQNIFSINHSSMIPYILKLVKFGVDVNAQDRKGDTVLHLACSLISAGIRYLNTLLDIGADINMENDLGLTPFDCQLSSCYIALMEYLPGDYTILYHHVQKLKGIGFKINPKNEACCKRLFQQQRIDWNMNALDFKKEELARKQQQRIDEITRMKSIKLNNKVSLYDFLRLEPEQAKDLVTHDTLMEVLQKEFPVYGCFLRLQHQKAADIIEVVGNGLNKRTALKLEAKTNHYSIKRRKHE